MRKISFFSALASCILLGAMGLFTIVDIFDGPGKERQEWVARTPNLPTGLAKLPEFLAQSRYYATARYSLKDNFITLNGIVKMGVFGYSPAQNVILGSDGYLFLGTSETIDGSQGQDRLDAAQRLQWATHFQSVKDAFRAHDLPYALVVGPNKHTIYPEQMPGWLASAPMNATRSGDVIAIAQRVFGDPFLDIRSTLARAQERQPLVALYHPTDTHWTEWGAALALHAVLIQQGLDVPAPQFDISTLVRSGDLSRMVGQQGRWTATAPTLPDGWSCVDPSGAPLNVVTIDPLMPRRFTCGTADARSEKLVVFTDSFGVSAIPYLAARFQQVDFIWADAADPHIALSHNADYVLQILVERKLMTDVPEQFLVQRGTSQ